MTAALLAGALLLIAGAAGASDIPAPANAAAGGPVTFCVDPDWPPYEIINRGGAHEGIAADLLALAGERAGLSLALHPTADWDASLKASREGACDLLSFLNQTPKREEWLLFTEPLFIDPNVIITHAEHPFIADLSAESDKSIALPSGTSIEERVRRDFPKLRILTTDSEAEAFAMVSNRKADLTIRSLTVAVYTIKKEGWFNLKVSGQLPGYENRLRVGVRKDMPEIRDRLDRGIATITGQERTQIANRHVSINVQTAVDYGLIRNLVLGFSAVLLSNLAWAIKLRKANAQLRRMARTDHLTGLYNRAALDGLLTREIDRSARYGRPLAVMIIDLDHFKSVNDRLGHLMGDRVLIELAGILRGATRNADPVGRWGGEEFLVLCPETTVAQALVVAERICEAVRSHRFETGWRHTVSAGVSALRAGDSLDGLLQRADSALYHAKHQGRDRAQAESAGPAVDPAVTTPAATLVADA
ncbi:diguanylate cyclase [Azospirillum sp. RWY-5-1]|uniref:diguanylate cyclase n=1 Tax=Azospirillum oleiclasticum TaxID=2735135 RepID=A0ABX2TEB1_9PROT|nr:diguanylate cyclase [Azospirillum oleiclasticum]NYZ21503.1 diguanylate cyclase [Azospirillum oleiclasticum]